MITSSANPQVKKVIQLQKKARLRREEGVFLVEGPRMFAEVPRERLVKVLCIGELCQRSGTQKRTGGISLGGSGR